MVETERININAECNDEGDTLLHIAAREGDVAIIRFLIAHGADVNERNVYCNTPLHIARNVAVIKLLISNGADVNGMGYEGLTVLHRAVCKNDSPSIKFLISLGVDVDVEDEYGNTPLHLARNIEIVKLLVSHGADVNEKDENGYLPFERAVLNDDVPVAQYLFNMNTRFLLSRIRDGMRD